MVPSIPAFSNFHSRPISLSQELFSKIASSCFPQQLSFLKLWKNCALWGQEGISKFVVVSGICWSKTIWTKLRLIINNFVPDYFKDSDWSKKERKWKPMEMWKIFIGRNNLCHGVLTLRGFPPPGGFLFSQKCSVDTIPNSCDVPAQRDTCSHLRADLLPIYVVHSGICKVIAILFNSSGIYKTIPHHTYYYSHSLCSTIE